MEGGRKEMDGWMTEGKNGIEGWRDEWRKAGRLKAYSREAGATHFLQEGSGYIEKQILSSEACAGVALGHSRRLAQRHFCK